jgi:uncharacterized OB-fold protein
MEGDRRLKAMASWSSYTLPLPLMERETKAFYDWCAKGELRLQRCSDCRTWRHTPKPMCSECFSERWEWERASGKGSLFAWCVVHDPPSPLFADITPYVGAIIALPEGPRMVSTVTGIGFDALATGMPVEVWFDPVTPEVTLPKFRPVR